MYRRDVQYNHQRGLRWLAQVVKTPLTMAIILAFMLLLSGCSRLTLFAVVNMSDKPLEVRYRMNGPNWPCGKPTITTILQLDADNPLQQEPALRYYDDPAGGLVELTLKPDEVFALTSMRRVENEQEEASEAGRFCVKEIELVGAQGEMKFQGTQAYQAFRIESWKRRELTYR